MQWVEIDGSRGEGGGQVLRTALGLSLATQRPFRIASIRAKRRKPGLLRQHLTAVLAAREIGDARVHGAELGSTELSFEPGPVRPGSYRFSIGTAGSASLVLQTILPALWSAAAPSSIEIEGGTHNPLAPPFDFLERVYFPALARMGPLVRATLLRHGFFPAGGGHVRFDIEPAPLRAVEFADIGAPVRRTARALIAHLPRSIAERELEVVRAKLGWAEQDLHVESIASSAGPGNVLLLELENEHARELVTAFGESGVRSEVVAGRAVDRAREWLAARVPVGEYLADQLLLPMALAGGGRMRTLPLSQHSQTHLEVLAMFLPIQADVAEFDERSVRVELRT